MSGRNWIFTINNPREDIDDPVVWEGTVKHLTYCVWQKEQGENGTPHFQGSLLFYSSCDAPLIY